MKRYVKSVELVKYNANTRGTNTDDCVKRAMSLAFDIPYNEMGKYLNKYMKERHKSYWNVESVYYPLMRDLGSSKWQTKGITHQDGTPMNLEDFVDNVANPSKIYLVETGKARRNSAGSVSLRGNHLVCIRNGKVWDSWDSRSQYVVQYAEINNTSSKDIVDTSLDLRSLTYDVARPLVESCTYKYLSKRGFDIEEYNCKIGNHSNYNIKLVVYVTLPTYDYNKVNNDSRNYKFKINYTFEPTMTQEDAIEYIQKITPQRVYDRVYAINEAEKELKEAAEVSAQLDSKSEDARVNYEGERAFRTLPKWVQVLTKSLYVQYPGQYHDSYELNMRPLPSDTKHKKLQFLAYTLPDLKDMLKRYKQKGEVPYEDYDPLEEY